MKSALVGILLLTTTMAHAQYFNCDVETYRELDGVTFKTSYPGMVVKDSRTFPGTTTYVYETKVISLQVRHSHYDENGTRPLPGAKTTITLLFDGTAVGYNKTQMELAPEIESTVLTDQGLTIKALCVPVTLN